MRRYRFMGGVGGVLCAVAVALSVLVPVGSAGSQPAPSEGGVRLALANGGSPSDVGAAVGLVAAGVVDALVVAAAVDALGEDAAGLVSSVLPSGVLVVGGSAAVSDDVLAQLGMLSPGVVVERLWGATRVGTAAMAARRVLGTEGSSGVRVALASGWSLADVGAAASLVAADGADAVLYGNPDSLGDETALLLGDYRPQRIELVGGEAALSDQVRTEAADAAGPQTSTRRLWGATRVETAARVARTAAGDCVAAAVVANGWSQSDVGAAAALAAAWGNSVVLYAQSPTELGDATRRAIADIAPQGITLVGDTDTLAETLRDALPAGRSAQRATDAHQAARLALKDPPHDCANTGGGAEGTSTRGGNGTGDTETVITTPTSPKPVTVRFGRASSTATEGGTAATVEVRLSADPERAVTVQLSVDGGGGALPGDYMVSATELSFAADQRIATFTVTAVDDSVDDDDESVTIGFGRLSEGVTAASPDSATVALADNDFPRVTASFGQSTYEAAEGGSVSVSVVLSAVPERAVTVDLNVIENSATSDDYMVSETELSFAADQDTATFTVTAVDDSVDDDDESVTIEFGTLPTGVAAASPARTTVSLIDGDVTPVEVSFAAGSYTAAEGGGAVTVTLMLSTEPRRSVDVPLRKIGGTATPDDYTLSPVEVTFAADQRIATFTVTPVDDSIDDDDESVTIGFGTLPVGMTATSPTSTEVTLQDNDDPQVTVSFDKDSYTATEGGTAATVTVKLSADPEREVTVPISVTGRGGAMPADYEVSATELTFAAGQTSATFTVTAVDDNFDDDGESVAIAFVLPAGVTAAISRTALVMLADNDDPLGQVTMSLPAGCVLRDLVAGDEMPYSSYVSGCASLHIPGRNAHYYRLVVRQEGAVTLKVRSTTASHLLVRSASGEVIARYDEPGEIQFYRLSLTRTLGAGTYVIEVAAQWSHFRDHGRGHTLSYSGPTIARPEAYRLAGLSITDVNLAHFAPGTTEYSRNVAADVHTVTVTPSAPLEGAKITVMPPDADVSTVGHQVDIAAVGTTEMTVAVSIPMVVDELVVYRVVLKQLAGTAAPLSDDANPVSLRFEGIGIGDFSADKTDYAYSLGFYERPQRHNRDGDGHDPRRGDLDGEPRGRERRYCGSSNVHRRDRRHPGNRDFPGQCQHTRVSICPRNTDDTRCVQGHLHELRCRFPIRSVVRRRVDDDHELYAKHTARIRYGKGNGRQAHWSWRSQAIAAGMQGPQKGFWSDGETVWVLHREDDNWEPNDNNLLYAYSRETQERVPAMDMEFPDESGSPTALWIDGEKMYQTTFWDVLYVYEFPSTRDIKGVKIKYDPERPEASPRREHSGNVVRRHHALHGDPRRVGAGRTTPSPLAAYRGWISEQIPTLRIPIGRGQEPRGIWSDGRTMWVIDSIRGYPEAYSMPENARLWKLSVSDGGIGQFPQRQIRIRRRSPSRNNLHHHHSRKPHSAVDPHRSASAVPTPMIRPKATK